MPQAAILPTQNAKKLGMEGVPPTYLLESAFDEGFREEKLHHQGPCSTPKTCGTKSLNTPSETQSYSDEHFMHPVPRMELKWIEKMPLLRSLLELSVFR